MSVRGKSKKNKRRLTKQERHENDLMRGWYARTGETPLEDDDQRLKKTHPYHRNKKRGHK